MISVIIPTHNRVDLLQRALESVRKQTYKKLEIIVISDGSTDDTDVYMERIKKEDKRVKFISYPDARGANYARNQGIEASAGEYIAFLDDDDEWVSDKVEEQLEVFGKNKDYGLVYTGTKIIYVHENTSYLNLPEKEGDLSKEILLKNYIGTTSTVMIKASVLEQVGPFDMSLGAQQDYDLWIRACQVTNVGVVSEPCINYFNYTGKNQISSHTEKYEIAINEIEKKYSHILKNLDEEEMTTRRSNSFNSLAHKSMRNNNKKQAFKYSVKSFRLKPSFKGLVYIAFSFFKFRNILKFRKLMNS